jgi:hypothetical protein
MLQRIITIEEALWIQYDEINAYQLLCEIQDWLGEVCQADFDYGWDHFMVRHGNRAELVNEAQRRGFDAAVLGTSTPATTSRAALDQCPTRCSSGKVDGIRGSSFSR